jgi:proteasome lid subunit RPN8/RPN11
MLRDLGPTEVGAFGVSRPGDLLLVEDVRLVQQACTEVTVSFDDESVADFFDGQVDSGRRPEEFARIWVHTHPGHSPYPSATDEETFVRCFGNADWAVMLILARGGATYSRMRYCHGPGGEFVLPVKVDFAHSFPASNERAWTDEYRQNVFVDWPATSKVHRLESRVNSPLWIHGLGHDASALAGQSPDVLSEFGEYCDA